MRVAYFPDSFHEVNGVAHTSRHFEAFTRRRNLPFLCVRAGSRLPRLLTEGQLTTLELPRGPLSFELEKDLRFDTGFFRHLPLVARVLREFRPDIVHITGPSDSDLWACCWRTTTIYRWLPHGTPMCMNMQQGARRGFWIGWPTARNPGLLQRLKTQAFT